MLVNGRHYTVKTGKDIPDRKINEIKEKKPRCLASDPKVNWSCVSKSRKKRVTGKLGKYGEPTFILLVDQESGKKYVMHYSCYDLQSVDGRPKGNGAYARRKYRSNKRRYM